MSQLKHYLFPTAMVAAVLVILVPLPTWAIDILLAANLAFSVLVLLTTVMVAAPLEFSLFPTVLLTATLGRLVLNVATTRLILSRAPVEGRAAAGGIVDGFGSFVAGDEIVVGVVIFIIILLIQFLVITKGATRISEVAARFALDGMPGRQMAIDADLSAGLIDAGESQRQRAELNRQADFFAAMDGASKFVRGDAIAGLAITLINVVGGLGLGVFQGGMRLSEAMDVFTRLTIGDGLVSQVPAFLVALGAGLLVTRSTQPTNLPVEFLRQLLWRPAALGVAAAFLLVMVVTRLPAAPLLVVGGGLALLAGWLARQQATADDEPPAAGQPATEVAASSRSEPRLEELLAIDPLELEIGMGLLRMVDSARGGDLLERIAGMRRSVAVELGMVLPQVRIRDNLRLEEYGYRLKVYERVVAEGWVHPLRVLAVSPELSPLLLEGLPAEDPLTGRPGCWVDPTTAQATLSDYQLRTASEALVGQLRRALARHLAELLTREMTHALLQQHRLTSPAVVDELVPGRRSLGQVQQVLQGLLREGISIRNLPLILEALSDAPDGNLSPEELLEEVRHRMGEAILSSLLERDGYLHAAVAPRTWELALERAWSAEQRLSPTATVTSWVPPAELLDGMRCRLEEWARCRVASGRRPVLLVHRRWRSALRRWLGDRIPELTIISHTEISAATRLRVVDAWEECEVAA